MKKLLLPIALLTILPFTVQGELEEDLHLLCTFTSEEDFDFSYTSQTLIYLMTELTERRENSPIYNKALLLYPTNEPIPNDAFLNWSEFTETAR